MRYVVKRLPTFNEVSGATHTIGVYTDRHIAEAAIEQLTIGGYYHHTDFAIEEVEYDKAGK